MESRLTVLLIAIIFIIPAACAQKTDRGSLVLQNHPDEVTRFIDSGFIDLEQVRLSCHFLTDHAITEFDGYTVPRRKTAFIRHIKHINEQLEEAWMDNQRVDSVALELLYELAFFEASLQQKTVQQASAKVSFGEKIRMWLDTQRSNRVFRYRIPENEPAVSITDPENSPFWHTVNTVSLNKQFDRLAKQKKIKARSKMVVLFDQLSLDGSAPKIDVKDLDLDNEWVVKWGDEIHADIAGSRIFAALGYDVDHPYFYSEDDLTLIFEATGTVRNADELIQRIREIYHIDLESFIASKGVVTAEMATEQSDLSPFTGRSFVRFKKCGLEARPDRVKRIGSFLPEELNNDQRRELRGALLAHQFIGNWDTREPNTLLTVVHGGNYNYRISAVFSDLGTAFGVERHTFPPDFKVGLVNAFSWEVAIRKRGWITLTSPVNDISEPYSEARYEDLLWMAGKIAAIDSVMLRDMVQQAHWPAAVEELYFHKLASRRASILQAFGLTDPHPIAFDRNLNFTENGRCIVQNGVLLTDYERENNPESLLDEKGRFRNYGN